MTTRILWVNDAVPDYTVFMNSVNEQTKAIRYSTETTQQALLDSMVSVDRLGIVFTKEHTLLFGFSLFEQLDFFKEVVSRFHVKHIDFLACDTLKSGQWTEFYEALALATGVLVGASLNKTGNLKYGGDWTMESTCEDIETVYFNKRIEYYQYLLGTDFSHLVIKQDGILYGMGTNDYYELADNGKILTSLMEIKMPDGSSTTGITKVVSGRNNTFVLKDGFLYGAGKTENRQFGTDYPTSTPLNNGFKQITANGTLNGNITDMALTNAAGFVLMDGAIWSSGAIPNGTLTHGFTRMVVGDPTWVVTKIVAGGGNVLAIVGGQLYGIGQNDYGQLGEVSGPVNTFVAIPPPVGYIGAGLVTDIACTNLHSALVMDGNLFMLGYRMSSAGMSDSPPDVCKFMVQLTTSGDVTQITGGSGYIIAIMNQQLYGLGMNSSNALGTGGTRNLLTLIPSPPGTIDYVKGCNGDFWMTSINGILYGMGNNVQRQFGGNSNTISALTPLFNMVAPSVNQISCGGSGYITLVKNGVLHAIGNNLLGQSGYPLLLDLPTFMPLTMNGQVITGVTKVTPSDMAHNLAVIQGNLYGTGENWTDGRIGMGTMEYVKGFTPIPLPVSGTIQHISTGAAHSIVVIQNKIYMTGYLNNKITFTECLLPAGVTGTIDAVESGSYHAIFLIGGKLYGIGMNVQNSLGFNTQPFTQIQNLDSPGKVWQNVSLLKCGNHLNNTTTLFVMNDVLYRNFRPYSSNELNKDAGATIEALSMSYGQICYIANGILYGLGNSPHLLGPGTNWDQFKKLNSLVNSSPIASVTCYVNRTLYVQNNSLYSVGYSEPTLLTTGVDVGGKPDIVNIAYVHLTNSIRFQFMGTNLKYIVSVGFGKDTDLAPTNYYTVTNATATSFYSDFPAVPMNMTKCFLMDQTNQVTIKTSNFFTISSDTCFKAGTPIVTDQGVFPIEHINPEVHTLHQKKIVSIVQIKYLDQHLVLLEKDSLKKNYPTQDTVMTKKHKLYFKGKMKTAESFVGKHKGVRLVPYHQEFLYNVLLDTHEKMNVNGLICESLHPKHPIAKYFKPVVEQSPMVEQ